MGFLDKLKDTANMAKEKAAEAIDQHGPQIKDGIGKAGDLVDKKTKGKYSDKIAKGTSKAGEALDKQKKTGDTTPGGMSTTPHASTHTAHEPSTPTQPHVPTQPLETNPDLPHTPPSEPGSTL